jgi:glycine/D-amino acid oxidase-like deaminating enzyme
VHRRTSRSRTNHTAKLDSIATNLGRLIVVERHGVAGAASGKSGGFLALDWCHGGALDRLSRRSFGLHAPTFLRALRLERVVAIDNHKEITQRPSV